MTSEEKVHKFLNEPIEGFRTAMINLLNEHAAEQREACAYAVQNAIDTKQVWEEDRTLAINACLNAVEK